MSNLGRRRGAGNDVEWLKSLVSTLQKENAKIKTQLVSKVDIYLLRSVAIYVFPPSLYTILHNLPWPCFALNQAHA